MSTDAGRHCYVIPDTRGDPKWEPVIVKAWKDAVDGDEVFVQVFCADCGGKRRRARFGKVLGSRLGPMLEMEIVDPPRRPDGENPGTKRGEPDAPQRVLCLDDTFGDEEELPFLVYCRRHKLRTCTFGQLREAYRDAIASEKALNIGL